MNLLKMTPTSPVPAPVSAPAASAPTSRLGVVLLGSEPVQRKWTLRLLVSMPGYVFAAIMSWLAVAAGYLQFDLLLPLTLWAFAVQLIFYVLLRGGFTVRWKDPALTVAQVVFGIITIAGFYAAVPTTRGVALQLLCLLLVFNMHHLGPRQILQTGAAAVLVLTATIGWLDYMQVEPGVLRTEAMNLAFVSLLLPAMAFVARDVSRLRRRQLQQRAELIEAVTQLDAITVRDGLTGLLNRRRMQELLEQEDARRNRARTPLCVAIVDIDFFKRVNDRHGHAVGDNVLRDVAELIQNKLREAGFAARWGGEEFVLLLPETELSQASQCLERLHQCFAKHDWAHIAMGLQIEFSAGLAQFHNDETPAQAIERADQALYLAKSAGRNRTVLA